MTQNEVSIIKNSVIDATEAYVEARLQSLDFVKTQIGVVQSNPYKGTDNKYRHTVKCNATSKTSGIVYNNVLSVGNIPFPKKSVVFIVAPNAQFSNQFILGKLDDTPCNISAGSIRLGGNDESDAPIYMTGTPIPDGSGGYYYGHICDFRIYKNKLTVGDTILSKNIIGCGTAGDGIVNMVGANNAPYVAITNSGTATTHYDGITITGMEGSGTETSRGVIRAYDANGGVMWTKYMVNIPDDSFGAMLNRYIVADSEGYLKWRS